MIIAVMLIECLCICRGFAPSEESLKIKKVMKSHIWSIIIGDSRLGGEAMSNGKEEHVL